MVAKTANEIWRDFNTEGVPGSGAHKPIKSDIREWGTQFEFLGGFNAPGADTSAALFSAGVGVAPTWRKPVGFDLPNPSTTVPGVVFAKPAVAGQVLAGLGTDGEFDTVAAAGTGSIVLNQNPVFGGTIYFEPSIPFATASPAGNHIIYAPDGRLALQFQNNLAYYKSNLHTWMDNGGGDTFATLDATKLDLQPRALTSGETLSAFTLAQTWNTGTGLVMGVDWRFTITSANAGSKVFRIRGGTAGNIELFGINADSNNPVLFMRGLPVISAVPGLPTTIYAAPVGTAFINASGSAFLTQFSNTGVWSFFGTTSGSHTLAAAAAASGASTFPNTTGTLINTGGAVAYTLAASAVQSSITGTLAETTLKTITVPGGTLGPNGVLRITVQGGAVGVAGSKQWKIKFGGTMFMDSGASGTTIISGRFQCQIANRNATNSQVGAQPTQTNFGTNAVAPVTGAIDTTANQDIVITGQLGNTGDTISVEAFTVEVLKP